MLLLCCCLRWPLLEPLEPLGLLEALGLLGLLALDRRASCLVQAG